jgi:hypothetical protein
VQGGDGKLDEFDTLKLWANVLGRFSVRRRTNVPPVCRDPVRSDRFLRCPEIDLSAANHRVEVVLQTILHPRVPFDSYGSGTGRKGPVFDMSEICSYGPGGFFRLNVPQSTV